MTIDWRTLSAEQVEQQFNPRVAVPQAQRHLDRYASRSAEARQRIGGEFDIRYGDKPKQTLDWHRAATADRPIVLFIHGGYWRKLDKSDHSFIVPFFLDAGHSVVNLNYDLCPDVSLDEIVQESIAGLIYCYRHFGQKIVLMGHSAGAHLAAMLLAQDWQKLGLAPDAITGSVLLTGIYEPELVLRISVNQDVQLTAAIAERNDCLKQPPQSHSPILAAAGALEPEGWIDQTRRYAEHCKLAGVKVEYKVEPGANHFSLLEMACDAEQALGQKVLKFIN
jgi:arylformamidase